MARVLSVVHRRSHLLFRVLNEGMIRREEQFYSPVLVFLSLVISLVLHLFCHSFFFDKRPILNISDQIITQFKQNYRISAGGVLGFWGFGVLGFAMLKVTCK